MEHDLILLNEINAVVSAMRRNARWRAPVYLQQQYYDYGDIYDRLLQNGQQQFSPSLASASNSAEDLYNSDVTSTKRDGAQKDNFSLVGAGPAALGAQRGGAWWQHWVDAGRQSGHFGVKVIFSLLPMKETMILRSGKVAIEYRVYVAALFHKF